MAFNKSEMSPMNSTGASGYNFWFYLNHSEEDVFIDGFFNEWSQYLNTGDFIYICTTQQLASPNIDAENNVTLTNLTDSGGGGGTTITGSPTINADGDPVSGYTLSARVWDDTDRNGIAHDADGLFQILPVDSGLEVVGLGRIGIKLDPSADNTLSLSNDGLLALAGAGGIESVQPGTNVTIDDADPLNPIVNSTDEFTGIVESIQEGANVTVDATDPANPIVSAAAGTGGQVDSVVGGTDITVDSTDPVNPIVNFTGTVGGQVDSVQAGTNVQVDATDPINPIVSSTDEFTGIVESIQEGANITVDSTDPANPIVSSAGGGTAPEVQDEGTTAVAAVSIFNFIGAGVTAAEGATPDTADITIPGGGGTPGVNVSFAGEVVVEGFVETLAFFGERVSGQIDSEDPTVALITIDGPSVSSGTDSFGGVSSVDFSDSDFVLSQDAFGVVSVELPDTGGPIGVSVPAVLAFISSPQEVAGNVSDHAIEWTEVSYDPYGILQNLTQLVVPDWATHAKITTKVNFETNSVGERRLFVRLNGASFPGTASDTRVAVSGFNTTLTSVSGTVEANSGDIFTIGVRQTSGSPLNLVPDTNNNGVWVQMELYGTPPTGAEL